MRRFVLAGVFAMVVPLHASAQAGAAVGSGMQVKGWKGRTDKKEQDINGVKFYEAGPALHVIAGPPAVYWHPDSVATGRYTVKATFTQNRAPGMPEAYGIFMGGTKLDGDGQNYLYCIVFGTGMFSVKHRYGGEVHTLVERRASDVIRKSDAAGKATNEIAWRVTDGTVSCAINGTDVATFERPALIGTGKLESTDGIYGIRVNHNLDVQITGFGASRP